MAIRIRLHYVAAPTPLLNHADAVVVDAQAPLSFSYLASHVARVLRCSADLVVFEYLDDDNDFVTVQS